MKIKWNIKKRNNPDIPFGAQGRSASEKTSCSTTKFSFS